MRDERGILAIFAHADGLLACLRQLKEKNCDIRTVYSPFRLREVQEILGMRPSIVRLITLVGGVAGGLGFLALAVYAHLSYKLITSGKPVLPWVAWVVVCFEGTILLAVTFSVVAWIIKGGLPRLSPAVGYDPRFSDNRFGILVDSAEAERQEIIQILRNAGAEEVRDVAR